MKPIIYFLYLIIALPVCCCAQQAPKMSNKDSLTHILAQKTTDSVKARASFLLAYEWCNTDTAKARRYFEQGKKFSKGNRFMQTVSLFYAATLIAKNYPDSAAKMYLKADHDLKAFNTKAALSARSRCLHDYAKLLHHEKDDSENYVDILLNQSIPLAQQAGDSIYTGKIYLDVAMAFKNLNEFKKAKVYLIKAIETLKKTHAPVEYLASAYHTLSENYSLSGYATQAAATLDSMKTLLAPYPYSEAWLDYYAGEGMRLTIAEQFDKSLAVINKGIALAQELKQPYPEQRLLLQRFYALYNKKDFLQARDVALDLTKRKEFMKISANRTQIFYALAVTYEALKNITPAYEWFKRYSSLSDSIYKSNLETKINSLEIKFRNVENQKKIVELNAANQKARLDAKNSSLLNWLLASASLFLLVVVILGLFFYRNNQKLSAQKEQAKITQAMLQGQEDERIRMARDLHDGLGGMLANVKFNLSGFAGDKEKNNDIELLNIIHQLDNSVGELRRIAHNLMPEMLLKLGLEASLRDLCESLIAENFGVDFQCLGISKTILTQQQIAIYRIVQELLANVVKHANARNVFLQCSQTAGVFFITIEDDGKGFNPEQQNEKQGIGLSNIKSRVAYLNGKMEVLSKADHPGTSINIELNVTS